MVTEKERKIRVKHMKTLGQWLKENGRTQRWAAHQLGIYHGYLSNLVTGKQVASEEICLAAGKLMGPLDTETGKPAGTAWTDAERRDKRDEERRKKAARAEKKIKKKVAVKRKSPPKPEDLPFEASPAPQKSRAASKLKRITSWAPPPKKLGGSTRRRHPGRRPLTPEEIKAVASVVETCIKVMPEMTGEGLVDVVDAVATGFAT